MNENVKKLDLILDTSVSKINKLYLIIKSLLDIFVSLFGVLLCIPAFIIIKIAYMLTGDFHSIMIIQPRIGKNGKIFNLYKFRSMIYNADAPLEGILKNNKDLKEEFYKNRKMKDDPRITKIGKIIRKFSIDELPQFVNILKGDMSFVGNRPYMLREKEDMYPEYYEIIKTKPGLTGLWQVASRNKETTFKERCQIEAKYSSNISLKLDLWIIVHTLKVIFKGI